MKNILFVSHSSELNGAELWLIESLKRLDKHKYAPFLIVPRPGPLEKTAEDLGIETRVVPMKWAFTEKSKIWRQPFARLWNIPSVRRLANIIREKGSDLVFTNSAAMSGGAKAAKKMGVPHVWAIHEILRGKNPLLYYLFGSGRLVNFILKHSAKVIVNSEICRAAFPDSDKLALIYNGVEIKRGDESQQNAIRKELGIREGDLVAGVVGKIYEGKGQREVILAVAALSPQYPNLKLLVAGEVGDKSYYRRLQDIVQANGLEGRVLFFGYHPDLVNVLKIMNVLVAASVVESFGRVALEGMAAGVPVLAVRAGGLPEIVKHGRNGFLVDSRDPQEIGRAMNFIFQNPDKAKEAVEGGFKAIREKFSLDEQVRGIERVIDESLG